MKIIQKIRNNNTRTIILFGWIKIKYKKHKKSNLNQQNLIKKIENTNYHILNIYETNTTNVGDLSCAPSLYYPELRNNAITCGIKSFSTTPNIKDKVIIVGGGGIFLSYFQAEIENILKLSQHNKIIFWGCGFDNYIGEPLLNINLSRAQLVGIRDFYQSKYQYVPCASCLSPLFDKYKIQKPTHKYVFYFHNDYSHELVQKVRNKYPVAFNKDMKNLDEALHFLASGEYVFTNSFHGLYWATLLGKKVGVLPWFYNNSAGFSYKFKSFKYKPAFIKDFNHFEKYLAKMNSYPQALEECKKTNNQFYKQVKDLIE